MGEAISYKVYLDQLTKHVLTVECHIRRPSEDGQVVSLPSWVPGSYMIRDFARNVMLIEAECNGRPVQINKVLKNTWQCAPCSGALIVRYQVYCFDLAPRGAYVDNTRVFFDGCRIFLVVEGEEEQTRSVEIIAAKSPNTNKWRCISSMTAQKINESGFGTYIANNHLELIDHPFAIGTFESREFIVSGVKHIIAVFGSIQADLDRFALDVQRVCQSHVDFFGELPQMPCYLFILNVLGRGYGGIEHRSSTSMVCSRTSLPIPNDSRMSEEYKSLLGLVSHEYFHLWNVKRIKPEVFTNLNLNAEVYTRQLWIFEGITAYYDNLNLARAKIISGTDYLELLQKDITSMLQSPGTSIQSLDDSSFDAWIKYYLPDENSINSTVSYYIKGSLVALVLDLKIILDSQRKQSLADVMQVLWQQYGKTGLGLPEDYFNRIVYEVTGQDYADFLNLALRSTEPLPIAELLLDFGVIYKSLPADLIDNLGLKLISEPNKLIIKSVINGSVSEQAGLCANDIIVAINGMAVSLNNIENIIKRYPERSLLLFTIFRNDLLLNLEVLAPGTTETVCELYNLGNLTAEQMLNQQKWLQSEISSKVEAI